MINRYALRTDGDQSKPATTLFADKYTGTEGNYGSGRSGFFLSAGNRIPQILLKGIGKTPLVGKNSDRAHSNGHYILRSCIREAITLEVLDNLMGFWSEENPSGLDRSSLPVAIIGLSTFYQPEWAKFPEPTCILLRSGLQIRPAHYISQQVYNHFVTTVIKQIHASTSTKDITKQALQLIVSLMIKPDSVSNDGKIDPEIFFRMAHSRGFLRNRTNPNTNEINYDIEETFKSLIYQLGVSCAKQMRWGIIHGAPSASNFEFDTNILDSQTTATNPRRGGFNVMPHTFEFGKTEFRIRILHYEMMLKTLEHNLSITEKQRYNFPNSSFILKSIFKKAYDNALGFEVLKAMGFKREVAKAINESIQYHDKINKFTEVLQKLAIMVNPGPPPIATGFDHKIASSIIEIEAHSVVDVFNLLRYLPESYFSGKRPDIDTVKKLLNPIYKGNKVKQAKDVEKLAIELLGMYDNIMQIVLKDYIQYYDNPREMSLAIIQKAKFENKPVELYTWLIDSEILENTLPKPITGEQKLQSSDFVTRFIHEKSTTSFRNTDTLRLQGDIVFANEGILKIEKQTWDNISYCIEINLKTKKRSLFIEIPLSRTEDEVFKVPIFSDSTSNISKELYDRKFEIEYRFDSEDPLYISKATLFQSGEKCFMKFRIPLEKSKSGIFSGTLQEINNERKIGIKSLFSYAFTVPDEYDLKKLLEEKNKSLANSTILNA